MFKWASAHHVLFYWLGGISAVLFVATLLILPAIVVRIPADYFAHATRPPTAPNTRHPAIRLALRIVKSVVGCILILAGLAMLVLPGQGLLTILIGLLMLEFPGKYRLERWLVSRGAVLRAINWLRHRAQHPALIVGSGSAHEP